MREMGDSLSWVHAVGPDAAPEVRKAAFHKAAESFESVFVAQLIRGMRESFCKDFWSGAGFGKNIYAGWFDQALSEAVVQAGGIGLKEQLQGWVFPAEKVSSAGPADRGDSPFGLRCALKVYEGGNR